MVGSRDFFKGDLVRHIITFFATGAYSGFLPLAPGTWGSVVGVGLYWLVRYLPTPAYIAMVVAFIVFAIWVSTQAQAIFEETDPQKVVIDEIAGILVTMAFHPPVWQVAVIGFILFRLFDITKPWPVCWFERRFHDGRGVVLDDVFAGIYANAALWLLLLIVPSMGINLGF